MNLAPTRRNFILLGVIVLFLLAGNWYINRNDSKSGGRIIQTLKQDTPDSVQNSAQIQQTQQQQAQSQSQAQPYDGRLTFHEKGYDFKYPKGWILEDGTSHNMIHVYSPGNKASVSIYQRTAPLQYSPPADTQVNSLNINIGGKTYNTNEYIMGNRGAYISIDLDDGGQHSILLGSDYPAKARGSLDDYYRERQEIFKILESLTFY